MRIKNKNRIRVIGKLIRIYREEKRHNTQNEYTLLRFCDGICTINTLKRIESGECSRSDEVYDELLAKLKLRFDYFPEVDTAVEMMMEPLYEAIEYFDLEGIGRICDKILNLLERVRNYVYYSELYNIFKNLRQYYIDDLTISTGIALRYESLLGIMPPIYSIILKFLIMTRKSIDALDDPNIYNTAIKKLEMINEKCLFLQFFVLKYYITTNQYISLMQLLNKLEMIFLSKENYIRLIDLYNYYFMLYTVIEHGLRDEYIQKVDNIAKSEKIPNYKLSEIYSNIASNLIFEKNYKRALEFFEKMLRYKEVPHITEIIYMASCQSHLEFIIENFYVPNEKIGETYSNIANQFHIHCKYHDALMYFSKMIKYQNIYYITDLIYMANCQSVLNKEINIPILSKMEIEKYPQILRKMYNFYLNYGISSPKEKQDFILNEIAPINEDKDLSVVFKFELKKAIKKNSCYKSLYLYEEIINNKVN